MEGMNNGFGKSHFTLILVCLLCVTPDINTVSHNNMALAASVELVLSSDITRDVRLEEEAVRVVRFNYTLKVTGQTNHSLMLAVCVSVDDLSVARATVSDDALVPLHTDLAGSFNVTVHGLFVGRAYMHVHFVVGHARVRCEQPESGNLQELLKLSESHRGIEVPVNVSRSSATSDSGSSVSPSTVGLHSGRRYAVVVVRPVRTVDTLFNVTIVIFVVIINVGMGCKLDLQVVKTTLKRPFAPITGLLSQFLIMPLVAFAVTLLFDLTPGVALGFFAIGCSPGGSISNAFCYLLGGDVSLSITMTFVSTVASLGMLPMWFGTLGRHISKVDDIKIPFENIILSLLGLTFAISVGLVLQYKKPVWARYAVTVSKVAICVFILFMCSVGVYANLYVFKLMKGGVMAAAAVLPYTGFLLGGLVAVSLRLSFQHIITIAIETGIQNTGVAVIVLLLSLDHPESDLSVVAPVASSLFTPIPLWIAVAVVKLRRCYRARKTSGDAGATTADREGEADGAGGGEEGVEAARGGGGARPSSAGEHLCNKLFGNCEGGAWKGCVRCLHWLRKGDTDKDAGNDKEREVLPDAADAASRQRSERGTRSSVLQDFGGGVDNPAMEHEEDKTMPDVGVEMDQDREDRVQGCKEQTVCDGSSSKTHSSPPVATQSTTDHHTSPRLPSHNQNGTKQTKSDTCV